MIAFVNGGDPWPSYGSGGTMVYDAPQLGWEDRSRCIINECVESTGRRDALYKIVGEELFDKLVDVWQLVMAGPREAC